MLHFSKKVETAEWCKIHRHRDGKLTKAIRSVRLSLVNGPWLVLCDNEASVPPAEIRLWKIPKHSPDRNPVVKCWSWLRHKLQAMGL